MEQKKPESNKAFLYIAYIALSCVFTAELSIIHSKFILGIDLTPSSFIMPCVAGVLFGYLLANNKLLSNRLSNMAYSDSLTQIYNRLHFERMLEAEIYKAKRYGGVFSIIFYDLDHFKQINDKHGHLIGDAILKQSADLISSHNRTSDVYARFGGEEFIILTAATNLQGAYEHADRLRHAIEQHDFINNLKITVSFGVTEFDTTNDDATTLLRRADKALYKAKHAGRNCVVKI